MATRCGDKKLTVLVGLLLILAAPVLAEESGGPIPANSLASDCLTAERLAVERLFWQLVENSDNPADIRAYLGKYRRWRIRGFGT